MDLTPKLEADLDATTSKITGQGALIGALTGSLGLVSSLLLVVLTDWAGIGMTRHEVFERAGLLWMILTIPMGMIFGAVFANAVARVVRAYMSLGFKAK